MHPSYDVAAGLHKEVIAVVAHPCRHAHSHSGPLVGGALGVAVYHHDAVVEVEHTVLELCLAEASRGRDGVFGHDGLDIVQIAIAP